MWVLVHPRGREGEKHWMNQDLHSNATMIKTPSYYPVLRASPVSTLHWQEPLFIKVCSRIAQILLISSIDGPFCSGQFNPMKSFFLLWIWTSSRCKDIKGLSVFKGTLMMFVRGDSDYWTVFYSNIKELFTVLGWTCSSSSSARYATLHSKIGWRKSNICQFGSGKWFWLSIIVELTAGKRRRSAVHL
jgi:hypothetical protein